MQCTKISVGMPGAMPMSTTIWRRGIITAWYGMNIPNRISVNTRSAPGNRQRESTNPLAAPIRDEITATGITSSKVRMNDGPKASQALTQLAVVQWRGRFHCPLTPISAPDLKLVTISTYTGISTTITKKINKAYFNVRAAIDVVEDWPFVVGVSGAGAATGGARSVAVTGSSPLGRHGSGTAR